MYLNIYETCHFLIFASLRIEGQIYYDGAYSEHPQREM
jgi:hypothetical protein